jgi:hypothetical protein
MAMLPAAAVLILRVMLLAFMPVVVGTDGPVLQPQAYAGLAENGRSNISPTSKEPASSVFAMMPNDLAFIFQGLPHRIQAHGALANHETTSTSGALRHAKTTPML